MTMTVEEVLAHHGVKGMKWGQRRTAKKEAKADAKWQKNIYSMHGAISVHNHVADKMNNGVLDKLNNDPKYKGKNLLDPETGEPVGKVGKQYLHDYSQLVAHHTAEAVKAVHGTSPSGKYQAKLDTSNKDQWSVRVTPTKVAHGIEGIEALKPSPMGSPREPELLMHVDRGDMGHITLHKKVQIPVAHSDDDLNDFLAHFGVKGMRWGRRKASGTHLSVDGKKNLATEHKVKTNKTGTKSLTNHELQQYNKRIELEQRFHALHPKKKSTIDKGHDHVKKALALGVTANAAIAFSKTSAGKAIKDTVFGTGKHFKA